MDTNDTSISDIKRITLDSGKQLVVTLSPYQDGLNLFGAILKNTEDLDLVLTAPRAQESQTQAPQKELPINGNDKTAFGIDGGSTGASSSVMDMDLDLNFFKGFAGRMLYNKEINNLMWRCMVRCSIDDVAINRDTFEDVSLREDYIEICAYVILENLSPFLKGLYAKLGGVSKRLFSMSPV